MRKEKTMDNAGMFSVKNKDKLVHVLVLNNDEINQNNFRDRVLVSTPLDFMFSYMTGLNYAYAVDVTDATEAVEYAETSRVNDMFNKNLSAAQEVFRDTEDIDQTVQALLPDVHEKVEKVQNENGSWSVVLKSNSGRRQMLNIRISADNQWTIVKSPEQYLKDFETDDEFIELGELLYKLIGKTMGDDEDQYNKFIQVMTSGVRLPDPKYCIEDGMTIRKGDNDTYIDLMLDSKFRIRMSYDIKADDIKASKESFIPASSARILYGHTVRKINKA